MREPNLDARPRSFAEASAWLSTLSQLTERCGLPNVAQQLRALTRWASDIAGLDAEVSTDAAEEHVDETVRALTTAGMLRVEPSVDAVPPLRAKAAKMTPDGLAHAIVEHLGRGPMIAGPLARALKASQADVKRWLKQAQKDGLVRREGYRWLLNPARTALLPAAAAKKTLRDIVTVPTVATAAGTGPRCTRCDCAFSDHDPTTGQCYGKKGKCICASFYR